MRNNSLLNLVLRLESRKVNNFLIIRHKPNSSFSTFSFASAIFLKQYSVHSWKGFEELMQSWCTVLSCNFFAISSSLSAITKIIINNKYIVKKGINFELYMQSEGMKLKRGGQRPNLWASDLALASAIFV